MQRIDAQRGQAHTVVLNDADQLGESRRTVAGAADGGGQRWHQVIERVTHALPALVNIEEGFDFHHGADTAVTGPLMAALEQPAIDFLALEAAGIDHLCE
ncbi:hypothetical protein D3C81_1561320 [compost metagenome]